ncbi:DNA polymerase III subunit beta [Allonocardiopsis opalescens]|uniref:Beta sliding clamp n=1 Tax=Allonocardiopsis opalescens TaxID=1144618 RepID=A0A2T0QAP0_9ACTN|nr:DNA polymerase III subunit beta [Allonocardiopsis opalescens]PRY00958.1 DNA polymerase-3 subunit beta [Allonocardiopsis opalescens]
MRFTIERDALADAVAWTARSLPSRPAVPVLAGILLEVGDQLTLSSFDYEVSARVSVDITAAESGTVLVSGRLLSEITRSLPDQPVEVFLDGARVVLRCGSSRFTLLTLPVEDYPSLPPMPAPAGTVPGDAFAAAVNQVAVAASRDDTLPMLTGVRMELDGSTITLAATNRFRLAVRELWWKPERDDLSAVALVHARTLADTAKALAGRSVSVALSGAGDGGDGMIGLEGGGRRTTSRLLDREFINFRSKFPTEFTGTAEVEVAPLLAAAKRVALVAERNTALRLAFNEGELVLEAGSGEEAEAFEAVEAKLDGEPIQLGFNPQYLLDGVGAVGTSHARFSFTGPTKPTVISDRPGDGGAPPDYRYLVMPLRF